MGGSKYQVLEVTEDGVRAVLLRQRKDGLYERTDQDDEPGYVGNNQIDPLNVDDPTRNDDIYQRNADVMRSMQEYTQLATAKNDDSKNGIDADDQPQTLDFDYKNFRREWDNLLERQKYKEAQKLCHEGLAKSPSDQSRGKLYSHLGYLYENYLDDKTFDDIIEHYVLSLQVDESNSDSHYNLANFLLGQGMQHLLRALELNPNHDKANKRYANLTPIKTNATLNMGGSKYQVLEVVEDGVRAVLLRQRNDGSYERTDPDDEPGYVGNNQIVPLNVDDPTKNDDIDPTKTDDSKNVIDADDQPQTLDFDYKNFRREWDNLLERQKYKEAERLCHEGLAKSPSDQSRGKLYSHLGYLYENYLDDKTFDDIIEHYVLSLQVDESNSDSHYNLANFLLGQGMQHLLRALELNPNHDKANKRYANLTPIKNHSILDMGGRKYQVLKVVEDGVRAVLLRKRNDGGYAHTDEESEYVEVGPPEKVYPSSTNKVGQNQEKGAIDLRHEIDAILQQGIYGHEIDAMLQQGIYGPTLPDDSAHEHAFV
eukprot:438025_1